MHKQKKISLNILLTACLLLASLWSGVILNTVKNRSTADATRWREFLYASQVDNREAYNYTYDSTKGWEYRYGTWTDNFANNIKVTLNGTQYTVLDFDTTTNVGKININTDIRLYTKIGNANLFYNEKAVFESGEWELQDESSSSKKIQIGANEYDATQLGGTISNPTYYISYGLTELYVKYSTTDTKGNTITPSQENNYGFTMYIDEDCTIEYKGEGVPNTQTSTPASVSIGGVDYNLQTSDGETYISFDTPQTINLYTTQSPSSATALYYNSQVYLDLSKYHNEAVDGQPTWYVFYLGEGSTRSNEIIVRPFDGNPNASYSYNCTISKLYFSESNQKLYIDKDCTIEYVGNGTIGTSSITYNTTNAYTINNTTTTDDSITYSTTYTFDNPDTNRYEWNGSDTNKYQYKDVSSAENFAQNSTSNVVILDNYLNNLRAKAKAGATPSDRSDTFSINNFYVSFGRPAETDEDGHIKRDSDDNAKIISALSVTAYLNNESISGLVSGASIDSNYGVRIKINDAQPQPNLSFDSNKGGYTNYYWYNYFDLTQIKYILNTNNFVPLLNAYGLYTIVFDYTVCDNVSGNIQNTKEQYVYQFYLTDDTNYVVYPTLNHSAQGHLEYYDGSGDDYSTTYYNSNTYNLPTYVFDASKYNVAYSHKSTDDITTTYNTTFKLFDKSGEPNKLGLLTINNLSYVIKLDSTNNKIFYYEGNESTNLVDDNLYGYIEIKESKKENGTDYDYTGLYLYLNGIKKYDVGMLLRKVAKNTPVSYYFPIVLSELGEYTFENKYIIEKDSYNFIVVEPYTYSQDGNTVTYGLAKNIFKNFTYEYDDNSSSHENIVSAMSYTDGIYQFGDISKLSQILNNNAYFNKSKDGGYNLVYLGTKSTFMKNKVSTPFQDVVNGVYGDITGNDTLSTVTEKFDDVSSLTTSETKEYKEYTDIANLIPITNLSPVGFRLYGSLKADVSKIYRWSKNLTKNINKTGYFITNNDLTIRGEPDIQTFTNGTSLERAGLYLIKVVVNYQGLDSDSATATQYFMFVIDNSDPEMYFYTGDVDSESGVVPEANRLGLTTRYTNADDLKFYWAEPTYFQENVTALIEYSSSYTTPNFGLAMRYVKGSIISSSTGNSTTTEGIYHLSVYYGQKPFFGDSDTDRSHKEATIYVDRTAPTASFFKYSVEYINGEPVYAYSNKDNSLISNGKFRLFSDKKKESGADITVRFSEINFNVGTTPANLISVGERSMVTTATYLDYIADNNITEQFYNLKSTEQSITNSDDSEQNLTLGSDNSTTPSKLYIFTISDEAGNSTTYYYIFDNSTPRAVYRKFNADNSLEVVNLDSISVSETTQVYWGNEKGILLNVQTDTETKEYSKINSAIDYINENSTLYKGLAKKTADGSTYLSLPLSNVEIKNSVGDIANTTQASQITIVTREEHDTYNSNTNWAIEWKDAQNYSKTISYFVSLNKTTYESTISDCLGNTSSQYRVYLDTDLANLTIFANQIERDEDDKVIFDKGINTTTINANNATIYFKKDVADGIESYVTYSYYPIAMASYFKSSSDTVKTDVFDSISDYTVSDINGDENKALYITYPFSKTPLYKDKVLNSGDVLLKYTDGDNDMSQEGLYVLNRIYRYTDTNTQLTQEQVNNLSENDKSTINMYIVVDRQGIVSLVTDSTGKVLSNESIGDLIYFTLGDGTGEEYTETIDANTLNVLRQNKVDTISKKELFSTNRVKVTASIPYDKYATALKLNNNNLTLFDVETNNEHIKTATTQNSTLYKLYVSLLKASTNEKGDTIYNPLILNNNITEAGTAVVDEIKTQQSFKVNIKDEFSLNYLLSMVQSGSYRLYISDKELINTGTSSNNICQMVENSKTSYYTNSQHSTTHYFDYTIEHKLPSGKYTSLSSELTASGQHYNSINKDALSFEFEDYANIYNAKIDPNHFSVARRLAGSTTEEVLLKRENGVYTTKPSELSEEYIENNIFVVSPLQNGLYKYTLNIFDDEKTLLSDRETDYIYSVTIYYVGQESFYNVTSQNANGEYISQNYYKATYTIHQDTTAPSQNLNTLIDIAREYAGEVNIDTYFFAIDRFNTGLSSSDTDESNQIYLRKFESLDDFKPSLLPGDENFAGSIANAPSFNPSSVDVNIYKSAWSYSFNEHNPKNDISFSNNEFGVGYYELLELDTAQNITRYFVYLNDESSLYANLNYNQKVNGSSADSINSVDYVNFDAENFTSPTLHIATLNSIEGFIVDNDELIYDDGKVATSAKDYYKIEGQTYYFDKFVIAYIKDSNGTTVKTVVCDALNEKLSTFYTRVVEEFRAIQAQNIAFNYTLEILNRFGENFVATLKLPDAELNLTITDKTDYFEVVVPAQSGNVYLTKFVPYRANGGNEEELSNDSTNSAIKKYDNTGLQSATYKFSKGDYKFVITDNYGRENVIFKFFGNDTDDKYTINFGDKYITSTDNELKTITFTNANVTLNINNSLWGIKCYVGQDLSTLKQNIKDNIPATVGTDYTISARADSRGKYTYTFSKDGYYYLETNRTFARQDSNNGETFAFRIDRTLPKAYAVFDSGTQRELTSDAYSENITIVWESEYDVVGTLKYISNEGVTTTYNISTNMIEYYVNVDGSYELTLTDAISNTHSWTFEKIKSSYAYFKVRAEGIEQPLQESKFTQFEGKTIIQYYYVKYSGDQTPEITILPDSSKGIRSQETTNSNDYMKEYEIISSNTLSADPDKNYTICYVRVVFVKETDDFANMQINETIDKDGKEVSVNITNTSNYFSTTYAKQLNLSFNGTNIPDDYADSGDIYNGNTIYLLHYYNGELVKRYNGESENSIEITRAGLHRFEIRDHCGNIQKWDGQDHFDLYVINSVIYTLNDLNPIPNSFYNDEVKLSIVDKLGDENTILYTYVATVLLNGKTLEGFAFDENGEYTFSTPGYYTITITATTPNSTQLTETFSFTIINQNVAMIAFNIPTSYGFTIESIYKNQANMTDSLSSKSTLWLSAGDEVFGSGVFTINASYYDSSLSTTYYFSFKVWINEETPTILPSNYTYGTKTSKAITLQYNGAVIYSQIGLGYIRITNAKGSVLNEYVINEESPNEVINLTINATGEFMVALYNNEGKLVSSYKVIKTRPLNSSAKIIIIIAVSVTAVLTGVFIFLRKRLRFR